jgi:hypothetical protein
MRRSSTSGLTRVELTLVLLCVLGLIGIVVPASTRELRFAKQAVAHAQLDPIARSLRNFVKSARPEMVGGGYGPLAGPNGAPLPANVANPLPLELLQSAAPPKVWIRALQAAWSGPYLGAFECDPWGRSFVVLPFGDPGTFCWCLSAGENGTLDTDAHDDTIQGDDVGIRVF